MYTLSVNTYISAAHHLNNYEGPCARVHGHNWKIQIDVRAETLNKAGIAVDFSDLEKWLWQIVGAFDHQMINSVPPFDKINPTAENLVKYTFDEMKKKLPAQVTLIRVSAWETDSCMVSYEE
jgi:6-pyruvoyltetrahydropterin/6-carboxytetrahydropterin synthase